MTLDRDALLEAALMLEERRDRESGVARDTAERLLVAECAVDFTVIPVLQFLGLRV